MRKMLITPMVLVIAKKSRTFPVSHIQLMGRRAGAGREHGQAEPGWPMDIFHTVDIMLSLRMGVGRAAGSLFFPLFSRSFNGIYFFSWEFDLFRELGLFWGSSVKFGKSVCSRFCDCCSGTGCDSVTGR